MVMVWLWSGDQVSLNARLTRLSVKYRAKLLTVRLGSSTEERWILEQGRTSITDLLDRGSGYFWLRMFACLSICMCVCLIFFVTICVCVCVLRI